MPGGVRNFQHRAQAVLTRVFGEVGVLWEWDSFHGEAFGYSPRLDLAVGPIADGNRNFSAAYDSMASEYNQLYTAWLSAYKQNLLSFDRTLDVERFAAREPFNDNARCFVAVEIENNGTLKHMLGSMVNASALGRISLMVGFTPETTRALIRLRLYLDQLISLRKQAFDPRNIVVLSRPQFLALTPGTGGSRRRTTSRSRGR